MAPLTRLWKRKDGSQSWEGTGRRKRKVSELQILSNWYSSSSDKKAASLGLESGVSVRWTYTLMHFTANVNTANTTKFLKINKLKYLFKRFRTTKYNCWDPVFGKAVLHQHQRQSYCQGHKEQHSLRDVDKRRRGRRRTARTQIHAA